MNEQRLYDLSGVKEYVGDDKEEITYMVNIFRDDVPEMLSKLNIAHTENDLEKIAFHAHKLKSSIDLFKIEELITDIRTIENIAKTETNLEQLGPLIDKANDILDRVLQEMKKDFGSDD